MELITSKEDKLGLRYAPFCFTEQGITMLSSVLNSERAIAVPPHKAIVQPVRAAPHYFEPWR